MLDNYDQLKADDLRAADFIKPKEPISKGQKIAVAILAFFGLFIVVAWAIQLNRNIRAPFAPANKNQILAGQPINNQDQSALQNQDTDSDGLSDWDELNVYKTSPYLEDTDSDGVDDKAEVDAGTDPNCPAGRDCYSSGLAEPSGKESASSSGDVLDLPGLAPSSQNSLDKNQLSQILSSQKANNNSQTQGNVNAGQNSINSDYLKLISGNIEPAALRRILLEHGMDKKMLDKISDEQLMQSFRKTWQEQMKQ